MVTNVLYLGRVAYGTALDLQRTLQELAQGRPHRKHAAAAGAPAGHHPGPQRQARQRAGARPSFWPSAAWSCFEIDRGGDVTFHGPGQLIAYPIFDLRSFDPKVGAVEYVRRLEEVLIRTCGDFGIGTQRIKGLTGVWTYAMPKKPEAKIAAIGVHISRSVTTHGSRLNVSTDLDFFSLIVPCGITNKPVTSMERELQKAAHAGRGGNRSVAQFRPRVQYADAVAGIDGRSARAGGGNSGESANQDTPAKPSKELRELHGDGSELA